MYANVGGQVFTFVRGNDTFDTTGHLDINDFNGLLGTVMFGSR